MPAPHLSIFYRPDVLPDAQPTVWKHWRQLKALKAAYQYFTYTCLHCRDDFSLGKFDVTLDWYTNHHLIHFKICFWGVLLFIHLMNFTHCSLFVQETHACTVLTDCGLSYQTVIRFHSIHGMSVVLWHALLVFRSHFVNDMSRLHFCF